MPEYRIRSVRSETGALAYVVQANDGRLYQGEGALGPVWVRHFQISCALRFSTQDAAQHQIALLQQPRPSKAVANGCVRWEFVEGKN